MSTKKTAADTYTVSLMAEAETERGTFEDVVLGTYPDYGKALHAAKAHVHRNSEAQAAVIAALPMSPEFQQMASVKALVYVEHDFTDEPVGGLIVEAF